MCHFGPCAPRLDLRRQRGADDDELDDGLNDGLYEELDEELDDEVGEDLLDVRVPVARRASGGLYTWMRGSRDKSPGKIDGATTSRLYSCRDSRAWCLSRCSCLGQGRVPCRPRARLCGVVEVLVAVDFADGEVVHERPAKFLGALPRRRGSLGPPASAKAGPAGPRAVAAASAAGGLFFWTCSSPRAASQLQA